MFDVILMQDNVVMATTLDVVSLTAAMIEAGEWVESRSGRSAFVLSAWGRVIEFLGGG